MLTFLAGLARQIATIGLANLRSADVASTARVLRGHTAANQIAHHRLGPALREVGVVRRAAEVALEIGDAPALLLKGLAGSMSS